MDNQNDYRQWPNVKVIDAEIKAVGLELSKATDQYEIRALRQKQCELMAKRWNQIEFNKAMVSEDKKAA